MLQEQYKIAGVVIHGEGRGKELGFPTANVILHKKIPEGIYAGTVTLNGKLYYSASFVGQAKTFQRTEVNLECHILDFDKDIYGKWISVRLYKKIRDNKKFESVESLIEQMKKDVEEIREYLAKES